MEWRKLKNLIILILLTVNAFLLVLVGARREEAAEYERSALEQTALVLENRGIAVDCSGLSAGDSLTPLGAGRELERELHMAQALLGKAVQADNRGGGLYLYHSGMGDLAMRTGGELSAELGGSEDWRTDHPERHAAGLLKKMGIEGLLTGVTEEGDRTGVRFRQLWHGTPVFSCEVEFTYSSHFLRSIQGTLLTAGGGAAEAGRVLTLPTALMRFSEEIAATGDVCTAVYSMVPGYRGTTQSLSGGVRLTPVWLVDTDTGSFYLDGLTGALTRAPEE